MSPEPPWTAEEHCAARKGELPCPRGLCRCGISITMTTIQDAPPTSPALVLQRWNSWVRVYLPDTRETRWVDLGESGYEPMPEQNQPPVARS
ncbi:MAG: hypothetical protein ACI8X5_003425 [Planctomycetota bacterium]|jgi:hypothetical protein